MQRAFIHPSADDWNQLSSLRFPFELTTTTTTATKPSRPISIVPRIATMYKMIPKALFVPFWSFSLLCDPKKNHDLLSANGRDKAENLGRCFVLSATNVASRRVDPQGKRSESQFSRQLCRRQIFIVIGTTLALAFLATPAVCQLE